MFVMIGLLLYSLSAFSPSYAALGEYEKGIEQDRARYSAKRLAPVKRANFSVHEISNSGLAIQEFTDQNGRIFAIRWRGTVQPDLAPLLGKYFQEFQEASKRPRPKIRTSFSTIRGKDVTVERSGHVRNAQGRAYVQKLFPHGVSANDIK